MLEQIKKLLGLRKPSMDVSTTNSQQFHSSNETLTKNDYDKFSHAYSASGMGAKISEQSLSFMIQQIPEFQEYFETGAQGNDVIIYCLKGFEDTQTMDMLPALWRRKSFIENCRLFGTEQIVFIDKTNNTFDLVKINELDISGWQ